MTKDYRRVDTKMAQEILLDDPAFLRQIVERVVQQLLEAEMTEHIDAASYEWSATCNGYKPRILRTRVGALNLLVPQDREGTFSTRLFSRYQRNQKALVLALMELSACGESLPGRSRKRPKSFAAPPSRRVSFPLWLASSMRSFGRGGARRLEAAGLPLPVRVCQGTYEKARVDHRVVIQGVLLVSAVRDDGMREILAVEVADTESEATYQQLFRSLKRRGLWGVELVVSDDHGGLKVAIAHHF